MNLPSGSPAFSSQVDRLSSANKIGDLLFPCELGRTRQRVSPYRPTKITASLSYGEWDSNAIAATTFSLNGSAVPVSSLVRVCVCEMQLLYDKGKRERENEIGFECCCCFGIRIYAVWLVLHGI